MIHPFWVAMCTAAARVGAPVLAMAWDRWFRVVPSERWTRRATSETVAPSAAAGDGHGLEGLRQRCQDNGADLTIEAPSSGSGTVLRVRARRLSSPMAPDAGQ